MLRSQAPRILAAPAWRHVCGVTALRRIITVFARIHFKSLESMSKAAWGAIVVAGHRGRRGRRILVRQPASVRPMHPAAGGRGRP